MARLRAFSIETTPSGQSRLRFTTVIINIGNGPFQVWGHDPQPDGQMLVDQQIRNNDGSWATFPTNYRMYFAGDGHSHWHVRDLEAYELRNSNASIKRTGEKHGFCFFDNYKFNLALPAAPQRRGLSEDRMWHRLEQLGHDRDSPSVGVTSTRTACRTNTSTSLACRLGSTP